MIYFLFPNVYSHIFAPFFVCGCSIPCYSQHRRDAFQEWVEQKKNGAKLDKYGGGHELQESESITAWMERNILRSCVSVLAAIKITSNFFLAFCLLFLFSFVPMLPFSIRMIDVYSPAHVYPTAVHRSMESATIHRLEQKNNIYNFCAKERDKEVSMVREALSQTNDTNYTPTKLNAWQILFDSLSIEHRTGTSLFS